MEKETKVATEDLKIDLFEDDDEFEEFEINQGVLFFTSLNYCLFCPLLSVIDKKFLFILSFNLFDYCGKY